MPSAFAKLDRESVVGTLRASGSRDPDVMHAHKSALLETAKGPRLLGTVLLASGIVAALTVVLVPVAVPLMLAGWWLRRRGAVNVATVEAGFAEYVGRSGSFRPRQP